MQGMWPLSALGRLAEGVPAEADDLPRRDVAWQAQGELRPVKGGEPEVWLRLTASADVPQECQRCLAPVAVPVAVDRWLRFVRDEDLAAQLDADSEDDVLSLPRWLDLQELVEDELLLSLPLVPRHERCPQPLPMASGAGEAAGIEPEAEARANPFAALAALKGRSRSS